MVRLRRLYVPARPIGLVIALTLLASALLAGAASSNAGSAKPVLRIGELESITPDPINWFDTTWSKELVYEGPLHPTPDNGNRAALATSFQWIKGSKNSLRSNKDFEFTLRHNARFSDGTLVTAQTIKNWWTYLNNYYVTKYGATGAASELFGVPFQSIQTVGKWTVIIHLESPEQAMTQFLSLRGATGQISSPKCVANPDLFKTQSCGAGPYEVDYSNTFVGDHITLVPNPYYYNKSAQRWSKIIIKTVPSASSLLQGLEAGQFDFVAGDTSTAAAAKSAGFTIVHDWGYNLMLIPNFKLQPAFADVRVRQALNYAIDRQALSTAFGGGYTTPTSTFPMRGDRYHPPVYSYDPAKAEALLAAAGHAHDLSLTILSYAPFGSLGTPMTEAIAKYFDAVGITTTVVVGSSIGDWAVKAQKVDLFSGPLGIDLMESSYGIFMKPGASFNGGAFAGGGWNDPVINRLYYAGERAVNGTSYWHQIVLRAARQAYFVPIAALDYIFYENPKTVTGGVVGIRSFVIADELVPAK